MERRVSMQQAREEFPTLVQAAFYRGDRALISRHGKPMAALIPIDEYERWKARREQAFAVFRQVWDANKNRRPERVEEDVEEEIQQVRRRRRARR